MVAGGFNFTESVLSTIGIWSPGSSIASLLVTSAVAHGRPE
jgi:hypothetical protein